MSQRGAICDEASRIAGLISDDATYGQVTAALRGISECTLPTFAAAVTCALMIELGQRPLRIRALVLTALLDVACEVKP